MRENFIDIILKNFFKASFALFVLGVFFYIMMPFMIYILLGGILAMALTPFVDFFMRRGLTRSTSLIVFNSLLLVVGLIPTILFFVRGSRVVTNFLNKSSFSDLGVKLSNTVYKLIDKVSKLYGMNSNVVKAKYDTLSTSFVTSLSESAGQIMYEIPEVLMGGLITILALYCFLKEADTIRGLFNRYFHFKQKNGDAFIGMLKACCREVFFSNIITGVLQAAVVSIGAYFCGMEEFFLIFFVTFIVSFIPIIGAAPVAVVLSVLCFIDSRTGAGLAMLVVAGVSGLSDNLIRPLLGSLGVVEVHPFVGLLSVIGGVIMFGLPGLFIGPLITALIFGALPIIINEYFPPVEIKVETRPESDNLNELEPFLVKKDNSEGMSSNLN